MKISNKIKSLVAAIAIIATSSFGMMLPTYADVKCPAGTKHENESMPTWADCNIDEPDTPLITTLTTIVNVILAAVGFIAVVMIIIGGISYTTSAGDAGRVKKAKDTILYGIIGIVIALLAFAIVNFVLVSIFS